MKTKKIDPAISKHFSKLAAKSWEVRKQNILKKAEQNNQPNNK